MKKILAIILIFLLHVSIVFAKSEKSQGMPQMPPTAVQVAPVKMAKFQNSFQATGSLAASQGITVTPEISGRITKIYFKSGQSAKKDDPLVQIYDGIIKAQLDKAKADLKLKKANYERYLKLYQEHFFEKAGLDQMEAELDGAKADVAQLEATLSQTLIRAPFDGQLGLRQISVGDYVAPGTKIVNLQAVDPIDVNFSIPETYLHAVKIGNKISIKSQTDPNKSYFGKIDAFNALIDSTTRTLDARATIPNPDYTLIPGSFAEVTVYFGDQNPVTLIPQTAILYSTAGNYVYRFVNNKAVKTMITLGQKLENNEVIIHSGLNVGDQVIVGGQMKLQDGAPVFQMENEK
ncbi:MAG: efflux RND transporter periplasmic adaptor subunit [Gammaproteobacteria bacterium]|nr:efflux RND transporter periplasmic adaptor subunit [Gammaproteobacteria bacterium]